MNDPDGQPVADGEDPLLGEYPPFELTTISAEDVARMPVKRPGPVTLRDRQGVFAHSFKCSICDLEFVVFSWRADRHRVVGSTFCPECGTRTPMLHWRAQTSESLEFCSDGPGREIYQMFSASDAPLMVDSVVPADDRYAFPGNRFGIVPAGTRRIEAVHRGFGERPVSRHCQSRVSMCSTLMKMTGRSRNELG